MSAGAAIEVRSGPSARRQDILDAAALYDETLNPLMKGILVNLALRPDFDPAPAVAHLCVLIEAGLAGRLPTASLESEFSVLLASPGHPSRTVLESSR